MFLLLVIERIQNFLIRKDIAGRKGRLCKDFDDKYLFQHVSELENFNHKAKQSFNAHNRTSMTIKGQAATNGSISGINFRETPRSSEARSRNAGATIRYSGRAYLSPRSRTSPGDLNTRRRCPRGILELFRYSRVTEKKRKRETEYLLRSARRLVSLLHSWRRKVGPRDAQIRSRVPSLARLYLRL